MPRLLKGLFVALGTALIGVVLAILPPGAALEQKLGLAALFHLRGPLATPPGVAVIAIDDQTGGQLGLSNLPREWPRTVHAHLVDRLVELGAAVIAFDFDFQLPKKAEDDAAFAAAISKAQRVVLAEKLSGKRQPLLDASGAQRGSVWLEKLLMPVPALASAARGLGAFPLPKVEVAVHEFWAFKPSVGGAPTMPAVALQIAAMPAYRHWVEALREAPWAARLPTPPEDGAPPEVLRDFMRNTRVLVDQEPAIATALRRPPETLSAEERALLGGLAALYAGEDHRLLNFYGPPGTIETVPYAAIAGAPAAGAAPPDLRGKAVFVGFSDLYDPGQPDRFYTVYTNRDGVDLSGVEIAATAYANLHGAASLETLGGWRELGLVAGFGALVAAILYFLPAIGGVPAALVLAALYAGAAYRAFTAANVSLPVAVPLLVELPLALFLGLALHYLAERRKKTRATQAISLYLPAHLASDYTKENFDAAELNRVTYSVCFASDMAGFTSIAEKLKPKELAVFLNDYFESLAEPLRRQNVDSSNSAPTASCAHSPRTARGRRYTAEPSSRRSRRSRRSSASSSATHCSSSRCASVSRRARSTSATPAAAGISSTASSATVRTRRRASRA
jgi:adenylate cyclase